MRHKTFFAAACLLMLLPASHATISVGSASFTYTQNFNALASTGSSVAWVNDSTLPGWSLSTSGTGTASTSYAAGNGASNVGAFYSFGADGSSERALGLVAAGSVNGGWIQAAFTNNSGAAIQAVTINFGSEQWRNGGDTPWSLLTFLFGILSPIQTLEANSSFNLLAPVVGGAGTAVDGNGAGLVSNRGGTISALNWTPGSTLLLRWQDGFDTTGNDHGFALDNFNLAVGVPEPATWALWLAGFGAVAGVARRRAQPGVR